MLASLVCSGSLSNSSRGSSTAPSRQSAANTPTTGRRARNSAVSARPAQAKPISAASPRGCNNVRQAGRKVSVQTSATSIPVPAISPSSATPRKLVGTKARNPAAMATAASTICGPTDSMVSFSAKVASPVSSRFSR